MALVLNGSDTSAGDDAGLGYTSAEGIIITGQGSTSDVTIKNDADATVLSIPTGTTNVGIGTTAAATKLHIVDSLSGGQLLVATSESDNADKYDYSKTIIIGRNEDLDKILSVSKAFDISINNTNHIRHVPDETLGVDVTIILGKDINSFPHISEYISQSK